MPTLSQCQILKSVLDKKPLAPSAGKIKIAEKLENIEINEGEEDLFGLQKLKDKLSDVQDQKAGMAKDVSVPPGDPKTGDSSTDNKVIAQHILPELPKVLRNNLYGLGFRKSPSYAIKSGSNVKSPGDSETDAIVKQLLQGTTMPKKKKSPVLKPRAVCFNYPGSSLTHLEVKHAIDELLIPFPEITMLSLEFQPRIKLTRPDKTENTCRWVITLNSDWGYSRMTGMELKINDVTAVLKRYNDVVNLEFRQHGRMTELMKMVKGKN